MYRILRGLLLLIFIGTACVGSADKGNGAGSTQFEVTSNVDSDAGEIVTADPKPSVDAPDWCAEMLTDNVLQLPSALEIIVIETPSTRTEELVMAAADDLSTAAANAPNGVRAAILDSVASLELLVDENSDSAILAVASSLQRLDAVIQPECEFSS